MLPYLYYRAHPRRQEMDRRRFEAAHIKYACLQLSAKYPEAVSGSSVPVESDTDNMLQKLTPALFKFFEATYAGIYISGYCNRVHLKLPVSW